MDEETDKKEGSFTVTDRRSFTSEGEIRQDMRKNAGPGPSDHADASRKEQQVPALDFSSFLLSLATTALVHLGDIPDPATGTRNEDLNAARQMIDILAMLEEKTEGNRTNEETKLLSDILYQLRMTAMSRSKVIPL